jgi:S1-C subfamily serine protease
MHLFQKIMLRAGTFLLIFQGVPAGIAHAIEHSTTGAGLDANRVEVKRDPTSLPAGGLPTEELFQKLQGWVFPLKTALSAQSPKKSYGTAFVVGSKGLLATNFHVIADALHEPDQYHLYLEVPDFADGQPHGAISAEILAFDIVHDLALVKVNRTFSGAFSLASEGDLIPAPGEKLWSLGKPLDLKISLSEGTFNGEITLGDYAEYFLSTQLNPGMSGGPTVDSLGIVRGVNFAIHRKGQNVSFVVPGRYLKKLINQTVPQLESRAQTIPQGPSARKKSDAQEMARQISEAGVTLVDALLKQGSDTRSQPMVIADTGLRFAALPTDFRCWQSQEDLSKKISKGATGLEGSALISSPVITVTQCSTPFQLTLADGLGVGGVELRFVALKQKKPMTSRRELRMVSQQIAEISKGLFHDFMEQRAGLRGRPALGRVGEICRRIPMNSSKNGSAQSWEVRFCVDEYKNYAPLKELALRIVGADSSGDAFIMSLQAQAFHASAIQRLTQWAIESVQWDQQAPKSFEGDLSPSRIPASLPNGGGP